ncbi:hypothetical protein JOB18_015141 [Solea senegalensis]|uniref:KIAA1522 n=1 Tax=Solea senegalensis TaxID=28829 RepID=A0AAV6RXS5_SOLSE|nr:uncharacterized protein KIAA1522 homolog [Solea senegalensis]XP_043904216.1 uncharacterized protein KIAA1522 homolog [Solea senegalensis]XP_043904217.1 uncharacterized protein KIAA1522 homolog [Solea senegalensis]XP_043904218.1 uncharacterized protein KIAA1522 homolog [Solea senegalensis]KAG7510158.1 hypothetical protein JOB18_015141 [Solea senegalensis]KAG7510159.1 hypothetical protein JOB18_015141 [Solea senegalensis]KAG7510160.1 hypothetical protein JOB18_015141 [Solea senegalensis]
MSNRDSLGFGDLLPQDVVQIFAQEKHGKRGHKKRSHSLGRALGWLKGKKRKDLAIRGQNPGLGPALDLALDGHSGGNQGGNKGGQKSGRQMHQHGNSQGAPKRNNDDKTPAPPLLQENVFIEASRPKYLEDLHTEAQEGLKMMQQEETSIGVEYQDNESTISTMTVQTDGEGGGFTTDSTMADTSSVVSVQSSVSTRSSRSGLTRQGSTFRPLNSGKKSEKTKRRRHRRTVAGIPHHVQRDLGLDRVGWTVAQKLEEEQLYNGETDESPTTEGPQRSAKSLKGYSAGPTDAKVIQALNQDQVKQLSATHAGHRDDLALLQRLGPDLSEGERPRSLAVPWMTTANSTQQELPSPVMSMSPQAAYMSKIIPNAVLPPSIEVVEINRGRSRNSVRTVSKSSLLLSSPAPSRASSRASSSRTTSSRASTITSASRHNHQHLSDSSCWSNSESSETLVSDSSTISGNSTPRQKKSRNGDFSSKEDKASVHSSSSKASKCTSNGVLVGKENVVKKDGQFVRSLSVMKSKKAPPPPSRSYSLHKMKRRSRDLAEVSVISVESSRQRIPPLGEENEKNTALSSPSIIDSPGYNADTSSLDDSTGSASFSPFKAQALKTEGAVNVEGPVFRDSSKQMQESLQGKKPGKVSLSSGYSSQDPTSPQLSKPPHSSSPKHKRGILAKLQKLFPGSSAGSAPSPLTQPGAPENIKNREDDMPDTVDLSPSVRALRELFNIPPPPKVHAPPPPPPEVWVHSKRSIELLLGPPVPDNIDTIIKKNPKDRRQHRHSPCLSTEGIVKSLVADRKQKNPAVTAELLHVLEGNKVNKEESVTLHAENENGKSKRLTQNVDLKGNQVVEAGEKARVSDILNGMLVKAVEKREEMLVAATREEEPRKTPTDTTQEVNIHSLVRFSPSPSPTVSQRPPQPLAKQTTVTPVKAVTSPESSWPPPPPPIAQVGVDDVDFPLPPPPFIGETVQAPPETTTISVVITEAEPQTQPLSIPPPPSYAAPAPPVQTVSPPTLKKVCPPPIEVSLSPPKVISPPPPPPPPIEISLPSTKVIAASPPKVIPPPPTEVTLSPPKGISPPPAPPPIEISLPSPKVISTSPPMVISPPPAPPIVVSITPPKVIPPPPTKEASLPPPKQVSPPSLSEEVPPPLPQTVSPSPPKELLPQPPDFFPPSPKESSPAPLKDDSPVRPKQSPLPQVQDVPCPLVIEVSPLPPKEAAALSTEEVVLLPSQENATQTSVEVVVGKMEPPKNIPPPPPVPSQLQSSEQDSDHLKEPECDTYPVSSDSILIAPQSIPPPPHIEPLHHANIVPTNSDASTTNEVPQLPAPEISIPQVPEEPAASPVVIPLPPPLPVQALTSIKSEPGAACKENQSQEVTSARVVLEEPTPIITPTLLQMVKLRSVSSTPEPHDAEEHPQVEVTMRKEQPSNQVPTISTNGEAPQKPIRKSLILLSPTSTSPPIQVTLEPALSKPQSLVAPTESLSTTPSPTKKSPPVTTISPSMNLQEAIRLRTAARSKENPASHHSLHSPKSPDLRTSPRSPSSTASFIFSKSNKKVVIETKPVSEAKTSVQNNLEVLSVTKAASEVASLAKAAKVPPPVAKKPKSKAKENETIEGTEQTAGQEAQSESIQDTAEKTNVRTSGTAEGGETAST